jgi:hypothetical protein
MKKYRMESTHFDRIPVRISALWTRLHPRLDSEWSGSPQDDWWGTDSEHGAPGRCNVTENSSDTANLATVDLTHK